MVEAYPEALPSIEALKRKVGMFTYEEDQYHELGRSNTVVYKALLWDSYGNREVALKIFDQPDPSMENEMRFAERQKLERAGLRIANDHIVEYIGWNPNAYEEFEGKHIGYIAQSLNKQRNMHQLIDFRGKTTPFSEPISRNLFSKIFEAVCYTHSDRIQTTEGQILYKAPYCHRDIKLSNVTFNDRDEPVLIDFGFATPLPISLRP